MADCVFCKIIKGEIPCTKIYEDSKVLAFLDISPVNKGHVIVIPKSHHETILDTPDDVLKSVIFAVKKVSQAVKSALDCSGFNILQNNFKDAGQAVPHLHFHIVPRLAGDGLKFWPQGKYKEGEAAEFAGKIISEL